MRDRRILRYATNAAAPLLALALTAAECNGATNAPPIAKAGPDQHVAVGDAVTLDGSASRDPNDDPLAFVWQLDSTPTGSAAGLAEADTPGARFTPNVAGTYVVTLTVSDHEFEASDSVTVTAAVAGTPIASAGDDQTVQVDELVTLDGSASSDPDGDPLAFAWEFEAIPNGSAAVLTDADTPAPTFTPDVTGDYVATLTASDGQLQANDSVTITASDGSNEAPSLTSIDDVRTPMNEPVEVPFAITDEDPGTVTLHAASDDQTLVADADIVPSGADAERSLRITPAPMGLGSVTVTLSVQDAQGLTDSASFALDVTPPFETQFPKLTASDASGDDRFGRSLAISGDYLVVGAPLADGDGEDSGSAYVFRRRGDAWERSTTLPPDPPVVAPAATAISAGDEFGRAVAIDGNYVVVGAPREGSMSDEAGAAYVYERCGSTVVICQQPWSEDGVLTADDAAAGNGFGRSVAIEGEYALVGAPYDEEGGTGAGAAYVFRRGEAGWNQVAKLTADEPAEREGFGWSVDLDGDFALVAAPFDDDGGTNSGAAYVFQRSGDAWNAVGRLTADDAAEGREFGRSVSLSGADALIGAPSPFHDDVPNSGFGSAYVFRRSGDAWNQTTKLASDTLGDYFGFSVGIDGQYLLIGARSAAGDEGNTGAAYVFQRLEDGWHPAATLTANDAADSDWFGQAVALDGDHALIGAPFDEDGGSVSGSAYVYRK